MVWTMSCERTGGYIFAEHPSIAAPDARLIWSKDLVPSVLIVKAIAGYAEINECFDLQNIRSHIVLARHKSSKHEFVAITDGNIMLRIDVIDGSVCFGPALLEHCIAGVSQLAIKIPSLYQLINLSRNGRMSPWREAPDPRLLRLILALRVLDALHDGASLRTIGSVLLGHGQRLDWPGPGESTRSYVRRLAVLAKRLEKLGPSGVLMRLV